MLIELKNITVRLGGKSILQNIDLKLEPHRITGIFGSSGSGLSILLKTAAGLIPASKGQVLYDGRSLDTFGHKENRQLQTRTGFMFQDAALWANMSLAANLALPLQAKFPDLNKEEIKQKIDTSLQQYGFSVDTNLRPVDISQGQKKFISFLRAVIPGPEALFLDEPVASMDRSWAAKISGEISALQAKGTTVVLAGNQYESTFDMADHLVILHHGQILAQGDREEIVHSSDPEVRSILDGRTVE